MSRDPITEKQKFLAEACSTMAPHDSRCYCVVNQIAINDSSWGTAGVGKKTNNPCNIRPMGDASPIEHGVYHSPGNGYFSHFNSMEDGIVACIDLYIRKYSGKTPDELTKIFAENPESRGYWESVRSCY